MDQVAQIAQVAGPWSLLLGTVIFGIRALIKGQLVPRSTVDALTVQWEARLGESHQREQDWRTAYHKADETLDLFAVQFRELMTYAKTTDAIVRALPTTATGGGSSGSGN